MVDLLMAYMRRVTLDAIRSKTTNTVNRNREHICLDLQLSEQISLEGTYEQLGTLPFKYHCGYKGAIGIVFHSKLPG